MDLSTLDWHTPFLELFKAPAAIMPRIVSNAEVYGHVKEGPLQGVPISGEAADCCCSTVGMLCQQLRSPVAHVLCQETCSAATAKGSASKHA
jgi:glycerol kinase